MLTRGGGLARGRVGFVRGLLRALRDLLDATGHGEDVAGDGVGVVLLRLGVFFRTLSQVVEFFGDLAQGASSFDNLADGALQLVEKAVEQFDHGADLIVRLDIDALGQVAVSACDGLQRGDHATYV